jgi:hypothetical protein
VTRFERVFRGALAAAVIGLILGPRTMRSVPQTSAQEPPPPQKVQKPSYDYMDGFWSRSARPLALKDDPAARRMLGQGPVPWAIRAGTRHILD